MEFPDLTKYIELKKRGLTIQEVAIVARDDSLGSVSTMFVLVKVFGIPLPDAIEIWGEIVEHR